MLLSAALHLISAPAPPARRPARRRDAPEQGRRGKLWDPSSEERWGHDKFEALERGEDPLDDEETLAVSGWREGRRILSTDVFFPAQLSIGSVGQKGGRSAG